ncbi:MAG TPA: threonine--tRNA ligase [Firmicutes bacterium]|nr:threonine--tRNA ligase [Bacillota bacterium]
MINIKEDKELSVMNHSCAHLMAQAVKHLYPEAKFWVGPVIEEGFYYDMDLGDKVLTEEDLAKIEKEMKKISKDGKRIVRHEISKDAALEMFKNDPYKVDLIENMGSDEVISCYTQGDFTDLCRGPHVDTVKELKYFKLLKFSGAYYKGDAKNKMLQRIYGVCFKSEEDLNKHLEELEEAKQRDHRKLGKDLGIFMFDNLVGKGLPMWLPNGFIVRRALVDYIMDKEIALGYLHVMTPSLGNVDLYKTSGHWDHYKDDMFPQMELDDEAYVLRPMNCPHHMVMFRSKLHSYRDLPVRIAEIANDFRYEASGAVCGIERTRAFTQNDSHIFCRPDQIEAEVKGVIDLILDVYKDFGFKDYKFRLSLRDVNNQEKYFGNDELWTKSEDALRNILKNTGAEYYEAEGEAAFYGPKIDVQVKSAIGHDVTLSTIQLDYQLPERFELEYINEEGEKVRPVVIHRAILGSLDRFIAFLLEETKGVLPLWLAPVQVNIIPVNNEYHLEYAKEIRDLLVRNHIRVNLDDRNEKLGYKLREAVMKKTLYNVVLGDKEINNKEISYRMYGSSETTTVSQSDFVKLITDEIASRTLNK